MDSWHVGNGLLRTGCCGRNSTQVFVDGTEVVVAKVLVTRLGHDLKELAGVVKVRAFTHNLPELSIGAPCREPFLRS